jgi:ferredoxin-type protein NapF
MPEDTNTDVSRRSFLRGQWRSKSEINSRCLNNQGVYCQSCKESCDEQAIIFKQSGRGIQLPMIISERCTHCQECVESCPVNAISISDAGVN